MERLVLLPVPWKNEHENWKKLHAFRFSIHAGKKPNGIQRTPSCVRLQELHHWLLSQDGMMKDSPLAFVHADDESGNGIEAIKDIPSGEILWKIPTSCILSTKTYASKNNPMQQLLSVDPLLQAFPTSALALCVLYESSDTSQFFYPYVAALPGCVFGPCYFSQADWDAINVTTAGTEAHAVFYHSIKQYFYLKNKVISILPSFSLESYLWGKLYI